MGFWSRLTGSTAREPPVHFESDDVYPVHMLDDTKTLRGIVVTWTLRFNDVLDADFLYQSLSKLLDTGDWKKIGGRLRSKANGELEIHVPRPFTAERPAVHFTHQTHAVDIEEHPLAKTLPNATDVPSIQDGPQNFQTFAVRPEAPANLEDYTSHDVPQLSLHVTSFNDATLVALSWPHTLMDVLGQQALLRGWSLVLAGRESEVPPLLGAREDAICAAADGPGPREKFLLAKKQLKGWAMLQFGLRFGWDLSWNRIVETRTVFLPESAVARLRREAQDDLEREDGGDAARWVSEGDVLTAWAMRVIVSSLPQPWPVTILHALNVRLRLPSLIQAQGVYVQNMAIAACAMLSASASIGSFGSIALQNRNSLLEQSTEGQVLASLRELRTQPKLESDPTMICGESDAVLMPVTNWTKADFFKIIDFSAAVQRTGDTGPSRKNPPGTIVFHHAHSMQTSAGARNVVVVLGKDHGAYWLTCLLTPATWVKIEEELIRLADTE